jgi:hypothetical protein
MLVATILGVLLIPSLFIIVERLSGGEKKAHAHATTGTEPAAHEAPGDGGHGAH